MILKWVRAAFLYFILVGLLGVLLRYLMASPIDGLNFRYLLHAHSHVAFLGWIFNTLFAGLIFAYVPDKVKSYTILFWLLQVAVVGMIFTFPIQGYAAASIVFSTLHIFLSWWFAAKFFQDSRNSHKTYSLSLSFVRWALLFMVFSAIGPFALGAIMAQGLSDSPLYNLAIYFYLHFQYNGWFIFACFALLFWVLEHNHIPFARQKGKVFLYLMVLSCIMGYALSALWLKPQTWVYLIGFAAAAMQLVAIVYLLLILKPAKTALLALLGKPAKFLFLFAFLALLVKIMMQFASAFPTIADLAYQARNFTIGYLHIVFIGVISVFLLGWLLQTEIVKLRDKKAYWGFWLFLTAFIVSELIIFLQPFFIIAGWGILPHANQCLIVISSIMPLGLMFIFYYSNLNGNKVLY